VYDCSGAMVITNTRFTNRARQLAKANGVELWDRRRLERELLSFCNLCEKRVTPKVRTWCLDRPERFGGRVYCFDHQRDVIGLLRTA
jgi:restriction system protein